VTERGVIPALPTKDVVLQFDANIGTSAVIK